MFKQVADVCLIFSSTDKLKQAKMTDVRDMLKDFPPGPLQQYRNMATFDWKKLKILVEDEIILKTKVSYVLLTRLK